MTNLISIGSIVQGTHRIPTLMALTNAKHGSPRKSIWKTAAFWFSIKTDKQNAKKLTPQQAESRSRAGELCP
jgi:hypothetical protein